MSAASDEFTLRARLPGGLPERVYDLTPSALTSAFFFLLTAAFTAIAFAVRAGYSNTDPNNWQSAGFLVPSIFLIIGSLCLIDAAITLTRDLILLTLAAFHAHIVFTLVARVVLVVAAILNIAGLAQLPKTMPFDQAPPSSSTRLRLVAAFLVILLVSFNLMIGVLGTGIFHRPRLPSFLLLASINFLIVPPALYLFIVVAVTDDSSPILQNDKLFFYLAFGLFQGINGVILTVVDLEFFFLAGSRKWALFGFP